jgi:hypothetical protein
LAPLVCLLVDLGAFISLSDSDEAAAAAAAAAAATAAAPPPAAQAACFDNSENNAHSKKLYQKHRKNKKSVKTAECNNCIYPFSQNFSFVSFFVSGDWRKFANCHLKKPVKSHNSISFNLSAANCKIESLTLKKIT